MLFPGLSGHFPGSDFFPAASCTYSKDCGQGRGRVSKFWYRVAAKVWYTARNENILKIPKKITVGTNWPFSRILWTWESITDSLVCINLTAKPNWCTVEPQTSHYQFRSRKTTLSWTLDQIQRIRVKNNCEFNGNPTKNHLMFWKSNLIIFCVMHLFENQCRFQEIEDYKVFFVIQFTQCQILVPCRKILSCARLYEMQKVPKKIAPDIWTYLTKQETCLVSKI